MVLSARRPRPRIPHLAPAQILDEIREDGAIPRSVNKTRAQNDHRDAEIVIIAHRELFRFQLGLGIAVVMTFGQRLGFVGAEMMTGRIDTETAHVQETGQGLSLACLQKDSQALDIDAAIFVYRAPGAQLAGTMNDDVDIQDTRVGPLPALANLP